MFARTRPYAAYNSYWKIDITGIIWQTQITKTLEKWYAYLQRGFYYWSLVNIEKTFYGELFMSLLTSTKHKNKQCQQIYLPQIINVILQLHKPR